MTNHEDFAARIARIQSGNTNTKGTLFVGTDEQHRIGRAEAKKMTKTGEVARNALYPLSLLGAFGLGLLSVAFGSYARFHVADGWRALDDPDLEMLVALVMGMLVSFVLSQMFRLTSKEHAGMQGAGVFVMVCAFHNLAHWVPRPMELAFSPEYVARIQAEAPPNSARFRGVYLPLFDDGSLASATSAVATAGTANSQLSSGPAPCLTSASGVRVIETQNAQTTGAETAGRACGGS